MCPLYDEETGEIEGWISDAPMDPRGAASNYIAVAEAVAMREERLDDMLGTGVLDPSWLNGRFHWTSQAEGGAEAAGNDTVYQRAHKLIPLLPQAIRQRPGALAPVTPLFSFPTLRLLFSMLFCVVTLVRGLFSFVCFWSICWGIRLGVVILRGLAMAQIHLQTVQKG